jgi:hypothetical protein
MASPVPAGSDVSAGTYRCTNCGNEIQVSSQTHIPPCPPAARGMDDRLRGRQRPRPLSGPLAGPSRRPLPPDEAASLTMGTAARINHNSMALARRAREWSLAALGIAQANRSAARVHPARAVSPSASSAYGDGRSTTRGGRCATSSCRRLVECGPDAGWCSDASSAAFVSSARDPGSP